MRRDLLNLLPKKEIILNKAIIAKDEKGEGKGNSHTLLSPSPSTFVNVKHFSMTLTFKTYN